MHWIIALTAGSLAYALADILCDEVIAEKAETVDTAADDDESPPSAATPVARGVAGTPGYRALAQDTPGSTVAEPPAAVSEGLTGPQDAAVSGLVTIAGLLISVAVQASRGSFAVSLKWGPSTHLSFWFALLGGHCSFLHNFFLLRAFEHAPSTVLLPLIQVASVSVLLGSSVLALQRGDTFITAPHALAYALMFVGGLLPATGGQLSQLTQRSFWAQRFVCYAVASELTLGLHDLLLSGCTYDRHAEESHGAESIEFIVWSRIAFVATFVGAYSLIPSLRTELYALFTARRGGERTRLLALSALSEALALGGYGLVSLALGAFYQPAIVHGALSPPLFMPISPPSLPLVSPLVSPHQASSPLIKPHQASPSLIKPHQASPPFGPSTACSAPRRSAHMHASDTEVGPACMRLTMRLDGHLRSRRGFPIAVSQPGAGLRAATHLRDRPRLGCRISWRQAAFPGPGHGGARDMLVG